MQMRWTVCLAVVVLLQGCNPFDLDTKAGHELSKRPPVRAASPAVALDGPGGRVEASVVIELRRGEAGGRANVHVVWTVEHRLEVRRGQEVLSCGLTRSYGRATDEHIALADARYELRAAPDGHALAASADGGRLWHVAALDTGADLLCCAHLQVPAAELWSSVPDTRSLVLAILGPGETHGERGEREAAASYLRGHPQDAELLQAVVAAVLRPEHTLYPGSLPRATREALQDAAWRESGVRSVLVETVRRADGLGSESARGAAVLLAHCEDAETQDVLAVALARAVAAKSQEWGFRRALAQSLASVTERRRAASPEVEALLVRMLLQDETYDNGMMGYGVRALWALGTAGALAALEQLAASECGKDVPDWPARFEDFVAELERKSHYAKCLWARAALVSARKGSP